MGNGKERCVQVKSETTLHHVGIPLAKRNVLYHYRVTTGNEESQTFTFKGYPSARHKLRVAVVGDWQTDVDLSQLVSDNPHLLLTVGDNVPNLYQLCQDGNDECIEPFLNLIDSAPGLFRTTPFMPILGNHDKQIRDRGVKYPSQPVYDIDATVFRKFFELPDDEWKWIFNISDFDVSFVALDLNHISDFGTTWQTCHDFHLGSEQMIWYQTIMKNNQMKHIITLHNERNQAMRYQENGEWNKLFQEGSAVITGYGHYSERAEVDGFPYFNTSLKAGNIYPDEFSKVLHAVNGYILLTFTKRAFQIEMKSLDGEIIDRSFW